ncbi:MAG: PKD domain-containing protein [Chloroflexota bacterium]
MNQPRRHRPSPSPEQWRSRAKTVTYTWPTTGTYTVMVTATNHCGQSITHTQPVHVYNPQIWIAPDNSGQGNPGDEIIYTPCCTI